MLRAPGHRSALHLSLFLFFLSSPGDAHAAPNKAIRLVQISNEPAPTGVEEARARIAPLQQRVHDEPKQRAHRFALVRAHLDAGDMDGALKAARAWREHDAYNLVAVRMLGDVLTELGREREALRVYSAVTELLAEDPAAQRSLASVLKQQGRFAAARDRLQRAVELRPDDARLRLELADVQLRSGESEAALALLESLVAVSDLPRELLHPTKSRLGQLYATHRRTAHQAGSSTDADKWDRKLASLELAGGVENHIKVYLSWDTDRSDVDLWVTTPAGEKIFYSHKEGKHGEALYHDITTGYGPESFSVPHSHAGSYKIEVNYFSSGRTGLTEARGEVMVILNEGSVDEKIHRLPYRLHRPGQTLHVATVEVSA